MTGIADIVDKTLGLLSYDAAQPLIFSSGLFLFLFTGFLIFYALLRHDAPARIAYVILFSLYFYYKSSGLYFLLLVFAATSDYWIARALHASRRPWARRGWVLLSVGVNLGMLAYFKYTNFLIDIANQLFGEGFLQFRNIFLPVGISFFVFQSLSYTIDIYRREIEPLRRWGDYLFYLSFFPQLVAGPIVRARDFLPQIRRPLTVTRTMFGTGLFLILTGLFKKAVISDYLSLNFVDRIFDEPLLYSGFECLMGIYGYALQIYCDFSGYSDMAIGIALLLGFRFPKNFDAPYKSATITEFWRRWHISLSTWFRDYVYIPLGGSRRSPVRNILNLAAVWLLTGLWHGAAWTFVLWGAWFFLLLAGEKLLWGRGLARLPQVFRHSYTLLAVMISWVLFRSPSAAYAGAYFQAMLGLGGASDGQAAYYLLQYWPEWAACLIASLPVKNWLQSKLPEEGTGPASLVQIWCPKLAALALLALSYLKLATGSFNPFIYFQF